MKEKIFKAFAFAFIVVCFVLGIYSIVKEANAQYVPIDTSAYKSGGFTGSSACMTNASYGATTYTVQSTAVSLRRNSGIGLWVTAYSTGATNANVDTVNFSLSIDGTNFAASTMPITMICPISGAATNCYFTNIAPMYIGNARYIRVETITSTNAACTNGIGVYYGFWNN